MKRSFPDDWSNLTDEQVLENVKYLYENISKYKIKTLNSESFYATVRIGNVSIKLVDFDSYRINNKEIKKQDNPILWEEIFSLYCFGKYFGNTSLGQAIKAYSPYLTLCVLGLTLILISVSRIYNNRKINSRLDELNNLLKQQELLQDKTRLQDKAKEYDATKLFNAKDSLQNVR